MAKERTSGKKAWVVQHHDEISVVESADRPDTSVEEGERLKSVFGPFASKDAAEKYRTNMNVRTLRFQSEQ